jgi:predicted CXXCH cytochrome family protein
MTRISRMKAVLWTIIGIAAAVGLTRFIFGLGVTTNMTDNTPWGFWIGFDVMGGVALAAGGFVIAAINHIFGREEFQPISRAAILTAFLGYIAVAVGLLFDLGLPWNIWHMIIFWNPHSPLFEVGWCVMLYLTVLFLEFAPVILEKWPNVPMVAAAYKLLKRFKIPIIILGIMLSTLHQSSLGSLFLAMPYKLHPLWYTPILPIVFFISAITLGLMMVMVESMTTSYLYEKEYEMSIIQRLRKAGIFMLSLYVVLRFADIFIRGAGELLFEANWITTLFWAEIAFSLVIPFFVFLTPAARRNINWMYFGAFSGVFGIVMNRLNVGGITHVNNIGQIGEFYIPSIAEIVISAGVVSGALLVFFYFIENFKVWEHKPVDPQDDPKNKPNFGENRTYFGPTKAANRTRYSFLFIIAFAIAFASFSSDTIYGDGYDVVKTTKARGKDTLKIDGNRDGFMVKFPHKMHENKGFQCGACHHMNKPDDEATGCYECHSGMYTKGDGFQHDWHASSDGANLNCFQCHDRSVSKGKGFIKDFEHSKELCSECHDDLFANNKFIDKNSSFEASSYVDAMHGLCIDCHETQLKHDPVLKATKPQLDQCFNCHKTGAEDLKKDLINRKNVNRMVVIPKKTK